MYADVVPGMQACRGGEPSATHVAAVQAGAQLRLQAKAGVERFQRKAIKSGLWKKMGCNVECLHKTAHTLACAAILKTRSAQPHCTGPLPSPVQPPTPLILPPQPQQLNKQLHLSCKTTLPSSARQPPCVQTIPATTPGGLTPHAPVVYAVCSRSLPLLLRGKHAAEPGAQAGDVRLIGGVRARTERDGASERGHVHGAACVGCQEKCESIVAMV